MTKLVKRESVESKESFYAIRCTDVPHDRSYLVKSCVGARPYNGRLPVAELLDQIIKFQHKKDAQEFLERPNMDPMFREHLRGAVVEKFVVTQVIDIT